MRRQKREGVREIVARYREIGARDRERGAWLERGGLGSSPVPDPPPAGLAVAGGEVAAESLASYGGRWRVGAPILAGGEGGLELGEVGGVLPAAGARRNRPTWAVAATRERGSWGREERGRETEREEAFGGVGWALSRGLFFFSFSLDGWMDGCGVDS